VGRRDGIQPGSGALSGRRGDAGPRRAVRAGGAAARASPRPRRATVEAAIDRWVWYAGWSDKLAQVLGGLNPVAGPYFDISAPEPTGVVAVLAPQASSLLGLVSVLAPVIVSGNTAVRRLPVRTGRCPP
jgi:acyl-CoA reductase-like NAD-dependent aldehyde dehydrogenase